MARIGETADLLKCSFCGKSQKQVKKLIAEHSGKTAEEVNLDIERDKILTADAALEYGLIDSILESRKALAAGVGSGSGGSTGR